MAERHLSHIRPGQRAWVTLTEEGDVLCITIDDNGPGIAAPDMERVFEPFVRLEASRSRETGGVGLGMTIARSIVRGHGWAASAPIAAATW